MKPIAEGMSHVVPNHVLRVGQTIRLDPEQETVTQYSSPSKPSSRHSGLDLDISLDNLNQLMIELDPTFEPIQVNKKHPRISPAPDGCCSSPTVSPSIPIPRPTSLSFSPPGTVVFSGSPSSSRPWLPCGGAARQNPSMRHDISGSQGSLRLSYPDRNSAASLLSTSTCSDTSYLLGSTLSLASEDAGCLESILSSPCGACGDGCRTRHYDTQYSSDHHGQEVPTNCSLSSPEQSLSGSFTDIPMLLINGVPLRDLQVNTSPVSENGSAQKSFTPHGLQANLNGSQTSMKFVMDSSKCWFCPHISRAEAEALVKDREPGTFVVRDSTTYRGSFGLAMKVDLTATGSSATAETGGERSCQFVKHFLIESSAKGVRLKGSSQEPYFGSLSALVYQHTISAFALPCKLLLHSQELGGEEEKRKDILASDNKQGTASNFIYLNAVPTERLTGPCAVDRAVSCTLQLLSGSFEPTIVNLKVSFKGITLTDVNRKHFFRRHYPAHLLSYSGDDPEDRRWRKGSSFGAKMFGFVAKGVEAGMENVCHVFAEYDPLQPCSTAVKVIQAVIAKSPAH
ncbi:tensin-4-like [Dunckerocampus dactyliophorus]|uniref:tensin-4-like n=1 Tax=Dunckerocampus dactyliophorus TaxID=161453 RepID=UPI002404BD99|nr:tensin-4-like [Dunckerocampus dactyliophorus]